MAFVEKLMTTPGLVTVAGRTFKRYHIDRPGHEITPEVERAAYEQLSGLAAPADAEGSEDTPPAGWVVLHRGDTTGCYLLAYSWVWDNVIEVHHAAAGQLFLGCPDTDPAHFAVLDRPWLGCVWELAVLEHERASWVRHVLDREEPDVDAYLADVMPEGKVGR